jgi:hypothetical protein
LILDQEVEVQRNPLEVVSVIPVTAKQLQAVGQDHLVHAGCWSQED